MFFSRLGKKAAIASVLLLTFFALPFSRAADPEIISASEAASLGLAIPTSTPAGNQIVTIEITDEVGNTVTRNIAFCKGTNGKIYWNNVCPPVTQTPTPTKTVEPVVTPTPAPVTPGPVIDALHPADYDPASNPRFISDIIVAGYVLVGALGAAGGNKTSDSSDPSNSSNSQDGPAEFESLEHGELARVNRKKEGRGDRSRSWNWPLTKWVDTTFDRWVERVSKFSPLLGRILMDNSYLQAMIGSLSVIIYPIAIALGIFAGHSVSFYALPPTFDFFLAIALIGIFDSLAGFLSGFVFITSILLSGHLTTRTDIFAMIGVTSLFYGPVLIASAFRPFRREVSDSNERWERYTDILLAVLVGGWASKKIVDGLNALGGKQYLISSTSTTIATWLAAAIFVRLMLEEVATHNYPARLAITTPHLKSPSRNQKVISLALKIDAFIFIGEPFIGHNFYLWTAAFLFGAPSLFHIYFEEKLPSSGLLHRVLPKGTVNVVVMVFVGTYFAKFLQNQIASPTSLLKWSFILLGVPGLLLGVAEWFADSDHEQKWNEQGFGRAFYRFAGLVVAGIFVLVVTGKIN